MNTKAGNSSAESSTLAHSGNHIDLYVTVLALTGAFVACYLFSASLRGSLITPDSGYTLPMAERIAEGSVLFRDLGAQHTTILLYIFAGLGNVLGAIPSYDTYLLVTYLITAVVVLLTAALVACTGVRASFVFLGASMTALAIFAAEGWAINVEPYVLLFGLSSHLLLLRAEGKISYLIFSGLLAGLACITKQYGLFILGASGLFLLSDKNRIREKIIQITALTLAFSIPVIAYIAFLSSAAPGGLPEVRDAFFGKWYEKQPGSFGTFLRMAVSVTPFVVLVPLTIRPKQFLENPALRLSVLALLLSLLQGFVRQYYHYYIHCIPYAVALSAGIMLWPRKQKIVFPILLLGFSAILTSAYFGYVGTGTMQKIRSKQLRLAHEIRKFVPAKSRVLLLGPPFFLYLCDFLPPDDLIPGYNFLHNYKPDEVKVMLSKSEYILLWDGSDLQLVSMLEIFRSAGLDLMAEIPRYGFKDCRQIIHGPSGIRQVTILKKSS